MTSIGALKATADKEVATATDVIQDLSVSIAKAACAIATPTNLNI